MKAFHTNEKCPVCDSPLIINLFNQYMCMGMCEGPIALNMSEEEKTWHGERNKREWDSDINRPKTSLAKH